MLGAIAGDIIGSVYEAMPIKHKMFPLFSATSRFTDDTVLTVAVADCLLNGKDYTGTFHAYVSEYPNAGYGGTFLRWALCKATEPYDSWGNGSAMRVSPVGWVRESEPDVLEEAKKSAEVTHNHPEGVKGAQATALSVFLARNGASREEMRQQLSARFGYNLRRSVDQVRRSYSFDVSCQGSVPESLICFLDSTDFEDAIRNAVSLGGDSDTMACIAGAVAEAYYGVIPEEIEQRVAETLAPPLRTVVEQFRRAHCRRT